MTASYNLMLVKFMVSGSNWAQAIQVGGKSFLIFEQEW